MSVTGLPLAAGLLGLTISVRDAASQFYANAFNAAEIARYLVPNPPTGVGPVKSVHLKIGAASVVVSTANPRTREIMDRFGSKTPVMLGGFSAAFTLYVDDVDAAVRRAVEAGGLEAYAAQDSFWGDRIAVIEDPFGHVWGLASVLEEISVEEHNRRWESSAKPGTAPRLELSNSATS